MKQGNKYGNCHANATIYRSRHFQSTYICKIYDCFVAASYERNAGKLNLGTSIYYVRDTEKVVTEITSKHCDGVTNWSCTGHRNEG